MKLKHLIVLTALLPTPAAMGQVNHNVSVNGELEMNTSILLDCSNGSNCPVNQWTVRWRVPEEMQVVNITDSLGEIETYSRENGMLKIRTNEGPRRRVEKLRIYMNGGKPEKITEGLYRKTVSLPGLPGEEVSARIKAENLLSATSRNSRLYIENDTVYTASNSSTQVTINFGKGNKTEFYTFFNGRKNGSAAYRIAVGTTGQISRFETIPVVFLEDEEYDEKARNWSQGEYSEGLIKLRKNMEEDFLPVLAEETVHAFNQEVLSFDKTSSTYLDEGIAGYIQSMVRKRLEGEKKPRNLFGEDTVYREMRNDSLYRITKPSEGQKEMLWHYYQDNLSFMKNWNAADAAAEERSFGYAYSHLIIKNYVRNNNSIRDLYRKIGGEELNSNQEKWNYYSNIIDLTPCSYKEKKKFEECLEKVNSYDYPVYYARNLPNKTSRKIEIEEIKVPEIKEPEVDSRKGSGFFSDAGKLLEELLNDIGNWIGGLLDGNR